MPSANAVPNGALTVKANFSAQDQEDIDATNAAIGRMRTFTPPDPYILTIPQDVEPRYHHSYKFQAMQWLDHTPFDRTEHESTQYQTFIFHEPDKEMYVLHNSRPSESEMGLVNGNASVRGGKEKGGTGANTPTASQGAKKTISFGAYKKQKTGGTPDAAATKEVEAPAKKAAVKGPVERIKADEEVLAAVEEDAGAPPLSPEKKDLKRKRSDSLTSSKEAAEKQEQVTGEAPREEDPVTKKARRRSASPTVEQRKDQPVQPTDVVKAPDQRPPPVNEPSEGSSLPPKLSPPPSTSEEANLPPKLSPIDEIPSLPSRLSPTIPTNITATLSAREHHQRSVSRSSEVSAPRSASKDANVRHTTPPAKAVPRNAFRANSSSPAVRSDAEERGRPVSSMPPKSRPPGADLLDSDEIPVGKVAAKVKKQRDYASDKASLMVRLKFKKSQRQALTRILKMRPNPEKKLASLQSAAVETKAEKPAAKSSDHRNRERRDTNAKGVAQKLGPATATNGSAKKKKDVKSTSAERKRPRTEVADESEERPAKRKKAPPDSIEVKSQRPSTPVQSALLSPTSTQKSSSQLTPGKALISAAMKREQSTESNTNTPPAMSQNSPPVNSALSSQTVNGTSSSKPPSSQPSSKTPTQQAWESESKRLETLGRELKHAASAHLKSLSMPHPDPNAEQRLAAIKSLESLLAYILAFTCADEAALAADPKLNPSTKPSTKPWKSLHGFFGFVKRNCEVFPTALGLACWLGVVFNARILDLAVQQQQQGSHEGGAGVVGGMMETQAMMLRAANEAESRLDVDVLRESFPRAWEGRTKGVLEAETLEVGRGFAGQYKLPLGVQSLPLRAARAGYAMLEEWIGKEGGEGFYEMKLKL